MEVGIREFRSRLRRWLDEVEAGGEVTITERGRPVARLVGASGATALDRLIEDGVITPATRPATRLAGTRRSPARKPVSDLVKQQRR